MGFLGLHDGFFVRRSLFDKIMHEAYHLGASHRLSVLFYNHSKEVVREQKRIRALRTMRRAMAG